MKRAPFELHVLILSEDSAADALPTVRALAEKMLRLVDPRYRPERLDFEPEGEEAQRSMHANLWQGKKAAGRQKLVRLAQTIARHILDERGIVLLHIDADQAWSQRAEPSENIRRFRDELTRFVSTYVDDLLTRNPGAQGKTSVMSRLLLVAPYWCIESWLYQNTAVGKALCHKHHGGLQADRFDHWDQHRDELDETERPKDQIRFGSKHNLELASQSFPARAVHEVGKSFFETVERLRSSSALVAGLAATHPDY